MYNFTQFTIQLNEMEDKVAPTDTRLRPDQRLMEDTKCTETDLKKLLIENKPILLLNQKF